MYNIKHWQKISKDLEAAHYPAEFLLHKGQCLEKWNACFSRHFTFFFCYTQWVSQCKQFSKIICCKCFVEWGTRCSWNKGLQLCLGQSLIWDCPGSSAFTLHFYVCVCVCVLSHSQSESLTWSDRNVLWKKLPAE
jgi:hypothetical protein